MFTLVQGLSMRSPHHVTSARFCAGPRNAPLDTPCPVGTALSWVPSQEAECKIMTGLSAGAPVWFGNASIIMNSLILPSAVVAELQILQWDLGHQGKFLSPHGCCWLCGCQDFHEGGIPAFLQVSTEGRMKLLRGIVFPEIIFHLVIHLHSVPEPSNSLSPTAIQAAKAAVSSSPSACCEFFQTCPNWEVSFQFFYRE